MALYDCSRVCESGTGAAAENEFIRISENKAISRTQSVRVAIGDLQYVALFLGQGVSSDVSL